MQLFNKKSKIFKCYQKKSQVHTCYIYLIKNTVKPVKYSYNLKQLFLYFNIFYKGIYFCNGKTDFFFINIKSWNIHDFLYFVKTLMHFFLWKLL